MKVLKRMIVGALALGSITAGALVSPAQAATVTTGTPPQVTVKDVGDPLLFGEARVSVAVRCFDGDVLQRLAVAVTQGEVTGTGLVESGIVCDGDRRVVPVVVSNDEVNFVPGTVAVRAQLTVVDPETGSPLPPASSTASVFLRPQVVVKVATGPVRLNAKGNAVVRASIKCRTPWIADDFAVTVDQNGGRIAGRADLDEWQCDGVFHEYTFTVAPNRPFVNGGVRVTASADVLDPGSYDPAFSTGVITNRQAVR